MYLQICMCVFAHARGVIVIVQSDERGDLSSNPSHNANLIGKGMNPTILPPSMDKL